jgi:hypothetical protein
MIRTQGIFFATLAAGLVALSGCGSSNGSIKGKVTYKGKDLPSGTVTFLGVKNDVASSPIASDGTYSIPKVSVGLAKITVSVPVVAPVPGGMKMDPAKMKGGADPTGGTGTPPTAPPVRRVRIPDHYQNPETSKLTLDVKPGSQPHDIKLE